MNKILCNKKMNYKIFVVHKLQETVINVHLLPNEFPFNPLASGKTILKQIIAICQIGIRVDISSVSTKHKHG